MKMVNLRLVLLLASVSFLGSHMAQANASREEDEGSSGTNTILQTNSEEDLSGDESGAVELELPELPSEENAPEIGLNDSSYQSRSKRSEPVFKCHCWIGWRYYIKYKYVDFGEIGLYPRREACKHECSTKCAPWLEKKELLCQKIGGRYDSRKQRSVGCFSQFGYPNSQENIWEFNNLPFELCCQSTGINCAALYGPRFYYNSCLGLCVKNTKSCCPPWLINNRPSTPHCCDNHKFSVCKKPKCGVHSVPCPNDK
ncbi:uncharacterized protein LOC116293568 [Actinia tenebrosa]|uniref:Uncharacterized protein LOC116293568 n=1 Tax=Actinia tenebrosa TaxID=6105 RepID=A0A6P8HP90_ACTTE|nr:uncharacterized protein LOC116293568 [Actinia tenebrosa]